MIMKLKYRKIKFKKRINWKVKNFKVKVDIWWKNINNIYLSLKLNISKIINK